VLAVLMLAGIFVWARFATEPPPADARLRTTAIPSNEAWLGGSMSIAAVPSGRQEIGCHITINGLPDGQTATVKGVITGPDGITQPFEEQTGRLSQPGGANAVHAVLVAPQSQAGPFECAVSEVVLPSGITPRAGVVGPNGWRFVGQDRLTIERQR
jgi:hypothetical protein